MVAERKDVWASGEAHEPYVGRWSRLVGREFVGWLDVPPNRRWLDVGCGSGALSDVILERASPSQVAGIDPSPGFVSFACDKVTDRRVTFQVGDAQALPVADSTFDAAVAGLVVNFIPHQSRAVIEMKRATRMGGVVAAYVWDYAGEMQMMRRFWDAAVALDPAAIPLDEGRRFPVCHPGPLMDLFQSAGLDGVAVRPINIPTIFKDFDDYWEPFLGGQAPAPSYCISLSEARRAALRDRIRASLPIRSDGSIHLIARAWGRARYRYPKSFMMAFGSLAVVPRSDGSMPEAERHVRCANLEQGEPRRSIMSHRNQDTSVRSRNVLCAALLVGLSLFPTSATRAEDTFRKACKVGTSVSILETDGNANSCRALAIQANVQNYQIGCQGTEHKDAIMLTTPISINDKSARLTSASLMAQH